MSDRETTPIVVDGPLTTPVLFLIFNRPASTARVFTEIRKVRPRSLYVSADGPRKDRPDEWERCRAARSIVDQVDWDCEVHTDFSEKNLGLKAAVSAAISWFFREVDAGIILEDDCVPSTSFFWFCHELLTRYRDDERVMQISGNNFLLGKRRFDASYYFSRINDIWGWATWRRAWAFYDAAMDGFPAFSAQGQLANYLDDAAMRAWLMSYFEEAYANIARNDPWLGWSTQWTYAMCVQNAVTIVPAVNLVANVGVDDGVNSAFDSFRLYSSIERQEIEEIVHPRVMLPDREADALRFEVIRRTDPRCLPKGWGLKDLARKCLRVPDRVLSATR